MWVVEGWLESNDAAWTEIFSAYCGVSNKDEARRLMLFLAVEGQGPRTTIAQRDYSSEPSQETISTLFATLSEGTTRAIRTGAWTRIEIMMSERWRVM